MLRGAGKGGGASAPVENADTLRSVSYARIIDLLGEGTLQGFVNSQHQLLVDAIVATQPNISGGVVAVGPVSLSSGGKNYPSSITVTVVDPTGKGTGATANATVVGGIVTSVSIINGGSNYGQVEVRIPAVTGQAIFLDETPLQKPDLSFTFKDVTLESTMGTANQSPLFGFPYVEDLINVNQVVTKGSDGNPGLDGISPLIVDSPADSVRISVQVDALYTIQEDGDIVGGRVVYECYVVYKADDTEYPEQLLFVDEIRGKCSSAYMREKEIDLSLIKMPTATSHSYLFKIRRISADSASQRVASTMRFAQVVMVTNVTLNYPHSALVGVQVNAEHFSRVPTRAYRMRLLRIQVPSNYFPDEQNVPIRYLVPPTVNRRVQINPTTVNINDAAGATPSGTPIVISGMGGIITKITVRLFSLSHQFPDDMDIILVGPTGHYSLIMSDNGGGGGNALNNITLVFGDSPLYPALPNNAAIGPLNVPGTIWRASEFYEGSGFFSDVFTGLTPPPGGYTVADLRAFHGTDPNGTWRLYIQDDHAGQVGTLLNGWGLDIESSGGSSQAPTHGNFSRSYNRDPDGFAVINDATTMTPVEQPWDGSFWTAWSDNPAWCFHDLATNSRYGLGDYLGDSGTDIFTLYEIARYCDELVPDGFGSTEPRFTCNVFIQSREDAYKVLSDMASVFRGMIYYAHGKLIAVQDSPKEPVGVPFTNANVKDGAFTYVGSSRKVRHTNVFVRYNDPTDFFKAKFQYVEDVEGILRYGLRDLEVVGFATTSRGMARRIGRYILFTERYETETCAWSSGIEGFVGRIGDIAQIFDNDRSGVQHGGRITNISADRLVIQTDRAQVIDGTGFTAYFANPQTFYAPGEATTPAEAEKAQFPQATAVGVTSFGVGKNGRMTLLLRDPAPDGVVPGAIWGLVSDTVKAQQYRVISITDDKPPYLDFVGVQYASGKFDNIEIGTPFDPDPISVNDAIARPLPPNNLTAERFDVLINGQNLTRLVVAWEASQSFISGYEVHWRKGEGNFSLITVTTGRDIEQLVSLPDTYTFRVFSIGFTGNRSADYAEVTVSVGLTVDPENDSQLVEQVSGLELNGQGNDPYFLNRDAYFNWRLNSPYTSHEFGSSSGNAGSLSANFSAFDIRILDPNGIDNPFSAENETLVYETSVVNNQFIFPLELNRQMSQRRIVSINNGTCRVINGSVTIRGQTGVNWANVLAGDTIRIGDDSEVYTIQSTIVFGTTQWDLTIDRPYAGVSQVSYTATYIIFSKAYRNAPLRDFTLEVRWRGADGTVSYPNKLRVQNPRPPVPSFTVTPAAGKITFSFARSGLPDTAGYRVWLSTNTNMIPANLTDAGNLKYAPYYDGIEPADNVGRIPVVITGLAAGTYYAYVAEYDVFGQIAVDVELSTKQTIVVT